ncbi:MAG: hypothetical protein Q9160_008662 [Pyrenula sp. 1 TL-2023]
MPPPTKRRKIAPQAIEEISFDSTARQEYLTGFHKRKLQRTKQAQEAAEKKARAERIADRRKLREERKADLARHVKETNALMNRQAESDEAESSDHNVSDEVSLNEWTGLSDATEEAEAQHYEAEYIDEDKNITVTVEAIDVSRNGLYEAEKAMKLEQSTTQADEEEHSQRDGVFGRDVRKTHSKYQIKQPKKRQKDFRYGSKAERKATKVKQRMKNSKQARARRAR